MDAFDLTILQDDTRDPWDSMLEPKQDPYL